jgi:hypothetical protein
MRNRPAIRRIHLHTSVRPTHRRLPNALVESTFSLLFSLATFGSTILVLLACEGGRKVRKTARSPARWHMHMYTDSSSKSTSQPRQEHTSRLAGNSLDFSIVRLISSSNSPSRERSGVGHTDNGGLMPIVQDSVCTHSSYMGVSHLTCLSALVDAKWYNYHY